MSWLFWNFAWTIKGYIPYQIIQTASKLGDYFANSDKFTGNCWFEELQNFKIRLAYFSRFPDNSLPEKLSQTNRRGQFVAGQFVADNSLRTIRCGQFVAKYKINFIGSTASISATLFSSIPLPLQQHYFHHSRFHISYIFSSLPLPFQLHSSSLPISLPKHSSH